MRQRLKNTKIILLPLAIVTISIVGFLIVRASKQNPKVSQNPTDGLTGIKYEPATEKEKVESDNHKKELEARMKQEENSTNQSEGSHTQQKQITPIISSWGQAQDRSLEVASIVPGIYEDGGKCTLTLEKDGQKIIESSVGAKNVSNVTCGSIIISYSRLSTGEWTGYLKYSSDTAQGTSQPIKIPVK